MNVYKVHRIPVHKALLRLLKTATVKLMEVRGWTRHRVGQDLEDFTASDTVLLFDKRRGVKPKQISPVPPKMVYRILEGHRFTERSEQLVAYMTYLTTRPELNLFIEDLHLDQSNPNVTWPEDLSRAIALAEQAPPGKPILEGAYLIKDHPNSNRYKRYQETYNHLGDLVREQYTNDDVCRRITFKHRGNERKTYDVAVSYEPVRKDSPLSTMTWHGHAFAVDEQFGDHYIALLNGANGTVCYHVMAGRDANSGEKLVWGIEIEHGRTIEVMFDPEDHDKRNPSKSL